VCLSAECFLFFQRYHNHTADEILVSADVVAALLAHVRRETQKSFACSTMNCYFFSIELWCIQTLLLLPYLYVVPGPLLNILINTIIYYLLRPQRRHVMPGICLFVCCYQLCVKTTKRIFTKILSQVYVYTRKNWLNFGIICLRIRIQEFFEWFLNTVR